MGHSIEMLTYALECAGRFLYRTSETRIRCEQVLTTMMNKKNAKVHDEYLQTKIENAFFVCNPPDRVSKREKEFDPMNRFVRKLLLEDLNKDNVERILKKIRRLPWADARVTRWVIKSVLKVARTKCSQIRCVCDVLAGLARYQDSMIVQLVDMLLEDIRFDLETNPGSSYQRRIGNIKLLGEMYNYNLVNVTVVFDVLHALVNTGHEVSHTQYLEFRYETHVLLWMKDNPPPPKDDEQDPSKDMTEEQKILEGVKPSVGPQPPSFADAISSCPSANLNPNDLQRHDPRKATEADPPSDLFRIHLICWLLDTCGHWFLQVCVCVCVC
jgi:hypothetical protein